MIDPAGLTVIFWSSIVNLPAVLSASIWVISPASTWIVAPLASVISVVLPSPLIVSYESILVANVVASTVVSLTAIVVRPVTLENCAGSAARAVANVPRSSRLLAANAVTLVKLTAVAVAALIVFN